MKLILKRIYGNKFCFSNPLKDSENELFSTKMGGVNLILEYFSSGFLNKEECINMFLDLDSVDANEMPFSDELKDVPLNQKLSDIAISVFQRFSVDKITNNGSFLFADKDGIVFIKSESFFAFGVCKNKEGVFLFLNKLFIDGIITSTEKENLFAQVGKSILPD